MKKSARDKATVTLGELYRRMSSDFRAVRPQGHASCVMPMVVASHDQSGDSNWKVEPLTSHCAFCRCLTLMIAEEYSGRFVVRHFPETAPATTTFVSGYFCAAD